MLPFMPTSRAHHFGILMKTFSGSALSTLILQHRVCPEGHPNKL